MRRAPALLLLLATLAALPARADELLDSYVAWIGRDDLYNSDGVRLTEAWQIIRQDRANYHRFRIRDRGDQGDGFFASAENRAIAEQMIRDGRIDPAAERAIIGGGVQIEVEIFGRGSKGRFLSVTVR